MNKFIVAVSLAVASLSFLFMVLAIADSEGIWAVSLGICGITNIINAVIGARED